MGHHEAKVIMIHVSIQIIHLTCLLKLLNALVINL